MAHHDIKIELEHYYNVLNGSKTCEIRKDDRDYRVYDTVSLLPINEFGIIHGMDSISVIITYVTTYMQKKKYVVWCFKRI